MQLRPPRVPAATLCFASLRPPRRQLNTQPRLVKEPLADEEDQRDPHAPYSPVASTSQAVFPPVVHPRTTFVADAPPHWALPPLASQPPSTRTPRVADAEASAGARARLDTQLEPAPERRSRTPVHFHLPTPPPPPPAPTPRGESPRGSLPNTERGLYHFLWEVRRTARTTTDASDIANVHGHRALRKLTSSRTYGQVLHLAIARSNWALVRRQLAEMRDRGVAWDERICRTMLVAYLKRGDAERVKDVLREMRKAGMTEPLAYVSWRRDLGAQSAGKGDPWKLWRRGPRDVEARTAAVKEPNVARVTSQPAGTESSYTKFSTEDSRLTRTSTYVPRDVTSLSPFDITALVESLVQDLRAPRALAVAEAWLDEHRPRAPHPVSTPPPSPYLAIFEQPALSSPFPPPAIGPAAAPAPPARRRRPHRIHVSPEIRAYNATAVVLLNILLKVLFVHNFTPGPIKDFVEYFIAHQSVSPEHPIVPNNVTLNELVRTYLDRSTVFDLDFRRMSNLVHWFGTEFGLTTMPHEPPRRFARVRPELIDETLATEPLQLPICRVEPEVAWCLLRVANHDAERRKACDPRVRAWWAGLVKEGDKWDRSRMRREVKRAVMNEVLPPTALGSIQDDVDAAGDDAAGD